ncbi:MAG: hypothetical protein ACRCSY_05110 [Cetobacterium sp.]
MIYFARAENDKFVLFLGVILIILLVLGSYLLIEKKCENSKIKKVFYIALILQIIILLVDNYFYPFPTIDKDARAFERYGWTSYLLGVNEGRGAYNYYFINPIYKIIGFRVAILFGTLNIFFNMLININLYKILKMLIDNRKVIEKSMYLSLLSPITLITRAGILREALIVLFISYSLLYFVKGYKYKQFEKKNLLFSFIFIGLASIFHSGVIFIATGYLIYLLKNIQTSKIQSLILLIIIIGLFFIFKDSFLKKFGDIDTAQIIKQQNYKSITNAGSAYLKGANIDNIGKTILYLPLRIFYFLYSPTPDMIRGVLDIGVFLFNSTIYIYTTYFSLKYFKVIKKRILKKKRLFLISLFLSFFSTLVVFSIGTSNAGTAMRHRDKIIIILLIIFAILKDEYEKYKMNRG